MQDSVPAALTKDKKRIDGQEVAVHLAWQSTLYVTNFPEKADDTFIRTLFAKVCIHGPGTALTYNDTFAVWDNLRRTMAKQEIQGNAPLLLRPVHIPSASHSIY